ncbi:MAG: LVIVD repeat-containing protein [Candidatus Bipolaricaulia bacterium]
MRRHAILPVALIALSAAIGPGAHAMGADHGGSPLTATPIEPTGQRISGCIEPAGDMDYFLFQGIQGRTYRLLTSHLSAGMDTVLYLFASDGQSILLVDDNSSGGGASRVEWACPTSGTYFAMVRHATTSTGTGCYEFSIALLEMDDHGNDALTATPIALNGAPTPGFVEASGDVDAFLFAVRSGYRYAIELTSWVSGRTPSVRLSGAAGETDWTSPDAAGWICDAAHDGTVFVFVSFPDGETGGYELRASERGYSDDFGSAPAAATPLEADGIAVRGAIEVRQDQDWFVLTARRGAEYLIAVVADAPVRLAVVAADGTTVLREDAGNAASPIAVEWTAPSDDPVFLSLEMAERAGTYALTVSSTLQLALLGSFNPQGYTLDVAALDSIAYLVVGTKGLLIVDASDPAHPREIGSHSTRGYAQGVTIDGDYAYVANRGDGLTILDVSDPTRPFEAGFLDTPGSVQDVAVHAGIAYVADQRGGLQIVDVSDPEAPRLLATFDTNGYAEAIVYATGIAYVAAGDAGLELVDVSDPSAPASLGTMDLRGDASDVVVSGTLAYVAAGFRGIRIVDVSAPAALTEVGSVSITGEVRGLALARGYLYVAQRTEGLAVYSLARPTELELVAALDTPGEALRVAATSAVVYVADREKGLQIVQLFR